MDNRCHHGQSATVSRMPSALQPGYTPHRPCQGHRSQAPLPDAVLPPDLDNAVPQGRQVLAHARHMVGIQFGQHHPFTLGQDCQDLPPGIYQH